MVRVGQALPKKSVLRLICYRFHALNISILLSILSFWAKPVGHVGNLQRFLIPRL
jgi:hypothetical protein